MCGINVKVEIKAPNSFAREIMKPIKTGSYKVESHCAKGWLMGKLSPIFIKQEAG